MATNNNPLLNCPPLRFPEFSDPWQQTTLGEVAEINPSTKGVLPHKFIYIDLEAVEKGVLLKHNIITKDNAPSRAQRLLKDHDVLFQMVRPYQQNNLYFRSVEKIPSVASTGYAQLRSVQSGRFLYYAIHSATFLGEVLNRCTGTNYPAINATDLSSLPLSLPSLAEQRKIAEFLSLIDERIETQRQTIEERKKQKKALLHQIFSQSLRFPNFSAPWQQTTLGEVCKVSTGEMNTQDKVEDGKYPFYVRSSKVERSNRYTYDGVAILTPGDGAIGQIFHYSEGKIAVHQRVYMLTEIQCIPKYLFQYFSANFFERASRMSAKNTVDSVRMNMITDMPISLPSLEEQRKIAELLAIFDERIEAEEALLKCYEAQKRYLLRQMFV
ncbi:restriction endonuclease subunit S [Porphyromonadaceae bacterium W3.11]|nr:restriction endonuclease subunit S [Porphyromonadaceae bacterium W3.11]